MPWKIRIPDHAGRTQSSAFRAAKKVARQIIATIPGDEPYGRGEGDPPWQMHHGGSLWVFDGNRWRLFCNTVGIEWSAQFCADPAKVDRLRLNAKTLYDAFPQTIPELKRLGYARAAKVLETPITDADTVADWVDSLFNACVPLPPEHHAAVLPTGGGRHHYPTPITDIEQIKFDDFELWVTDKETQTTVAVLPVDRRGSGDAHTTLTWAPVGHPLAEKKMREARRRKRVVFDPDSDFSKQAFARQ